MAASIFVNPTQFGPSEDLASYPRDLPRDLARLEAAGVDLVWTPTPEIVYPPDFQTWITVEEVARPLEGAQRPGHFRGVATVVAKLFNAFQPHRAYFGQKDAQQVAVIKQMARDLNFPVDVVVCPTVREPRCGNATAWPCPAATPISTPSSARPRRCSSARLARPPQPSQPANRMPRACAS